MLFSAKWNLPFPLVTWITPDITIINKQITFVTIAFLLTNISLLLSKIYLNLSIKMHIFYLYYIKIAIPVQASNIIGYLNYINFCICAHKKSILIK